MNDVDTRSPADFDRQPQGVPQGEEVLAQIPPRRAAGRRPQRVTQNTDTLDRLLRLGVLVVPFGTNDADLEPRPRQGRASCQTRLSKGTDRFSTRISMCRFFMRGLPLLVCTRH